MRLIRAVKTYLCPQDPDVKQLSKLLLAPPYSLLEFGQMVNTVMVTYGRQEEQQQDWTLNVQIALERLRY